jgi:hypothetical protein
VRKAEELKDLRVGIVPSGRNVDLARLLVMPGRPASVSGFQYVVDVGLVEVVLDLS